jgi:rubrerythrin
MAKFDSVNSILDFAIQREEEAWKFYLDLAERMDRREMREVFESFAREEQRHKSKLESVKAGEIPAPSTVKVTSLDMTDYLSDVEPGPNMEYQDALIVAMKKEKAAFKLYNDLATAADDENLRGLFLGLAQEEAKHKLRFEIEYDEYVLREN